MSEKGAGRRLSSHREQTDKNGLCFKHRCKCFQTSPSHQATRTWGLQLTEQEGGKLKHSGWRTVPGRLYVSSDKLTSLRVVKEQTISIMELQPPNSPGFSLSLCKHASLSQYITSFRRQLNSVRNRWMQRQIQAVLAKTGFQALLIHNITYSAWSVLWELNKHGSQEWKYYTKMLLPRIVDNIQLRNL